MPDADLNSKNYYENLGVNPDTTNDREIKRAYNALVKANHPDKNPGLEENFNTVKEAYEAIKDAQLRAIYNTKLAKEENQTQPKRTASQPSTSSSTWSQQSRNTRNTGASTSGTTSKPTYSGTGLFKWTKGIPAGFLISPKQSKKLIYFLNMSDYMCSSQETKQSHMNFIESSLNSHHFIDRYYPSSSECHFEYFKTSTGGQNSEGIIFYTSPKTPHPEGILKKIIANRINNVKNNNIPRSRQILTSVLGTPEEPSQQRSGYGR